MRLFLVLTIAAGLLTPATFAAGKKGGGAKMSHAKGGKSKKH